MNQIMCCGKITVSLHMLLHICTDIKECVIGTHNCSQQCIELPGRFGCECYHGYQPQPDNIICEGKILLLC